MDSSMSTDRTDTPSDHISSASTNVTDTLSSCGALPAAEEDALATAHIAVSASVAAPVAVPVAVPSANTTSRFATEPDASLRIRSSRVAALRRARE
eukprot:7390991-Prymnesium_polylepis.1